MIQISEWLPNPVGKDSAQNLPSQTSHNGILGGEWIELFNSGGTPVNLSGYKLRTANGKAAALSGTINSGEYKIFSRSLTGLTLRNTDEKLTLVSPAGQITDESSFRGPAEEGLSVNHEGAHSFFAAPTPGAKNVLRESVLINDPHPAGVPLNAAHPAAAFWGGLIGTAIVLPAMIVYILKQNNDLSELFFGAN